MLYAELWKLPFTALQSTKVSHSSLQSIPSLTTGTVMAVATYTVAVAMRQDPVVVNCARCTSEILSNPFKQKQSGPMHVILYIYFFYMFWVWLSRWLTLLSLTSWVTYATICCEKKHSILRVNNVVFVTGVVFSIGPPFFSHLTYINH